MIHANITVVSGSYANVCKSQSLSTEESVKTHNLGSETRFLSKYFFSPQTTREHFIMVDVGLKFEPLFEPGITTVSFLFSSQCMMVI